MSRPVTFTLDLEDLRTSPEQESRVERTAHEVFDLVASLGVRGTVFVVGELAEAHPGLVKRVAEDGHELGLHSYRHVPIGSVAPDRFRAETSRGKEVLEQLGQHPVRGYRAPMMSLVPESSWALPVLADLGFDYSSSVLPAPSPLFGWPGLPTTPFRWDTGTVELPCPLVRVLGTQIPFLGGTYLRILPDRIRRYGTDRSPVDQVLWTYCHPWEFDPDEPYYQFDHIGALASRVGWLNRRRMAARVTRVLTGPAGPPLAELVDGLDRAALPEVAVDSAAAYEPGRLAGLVGGLLRRGRDAA
jgi:polysaccharide deacetylase family protein (PEP-CTERM system associated)